MNILLKTLASIVIAAITATWTAFIAGALSYIASPYGWWSVAFLILFGLLALNLMYFVFSLPSLLIFMIKERSRNLNYCIVGIYIIGVIISMAASWYTINGFINIPNAIVAIIIDILIVIFYKRKSFELFEPE